MIRPSLLPIAILLTIFLLASGGALAQGNAEQENGLQPSVSSEEEGKKEMWDSLSQEEQERLRSALRRVWADPAVLSAREEVKDASEAYQAAIRQAVKRVDPSVSESLARAQAVSQGQVKERLGGAIPGRPALRRVGDYPLGPPGFMETLTEDERQRFRKAEQEARKSEPVVNAIKLLENLHKEDEALRRKRLDALRKMRQTVLNKMVELDPTLADVQERLAATTRRQGKGKAGAGKEN